MIRKEYLQVGDTIYIDYYGDCVVSDYKTAKEKWVDGVSDVHNMQIWAICLTVKGGLKRDVPYKFNVSYIIQHRSQAKDYDPKQQPYEDGDI